MMKPALLFFILLLIIVEAQLQTTPLIQSNFEKVTSYEELSTFVNLLDQQSEVLQHEIIGKSIQGRNIYALKFSSSEFDKDKSKIKVLIFAQQHGNEQSGKEGALLLAKKLIQPEYRYLFDRIDFALIPQVNPDGSELNQRRNGNDVDLNRNHLILTEPETMALHQFFDQYLFEVTMDVHEYYPYDEAWMQYGYRKNADITVGTTTNINVSKKIRDFSRDKYLPFVFKYLNERNFTSFHYCPGGPPEETFLRYSTFDINDGRQSLGIQNTLSFIQEGMNGEDSFVDNIRHRAEGQCAGMLGLLEFVYQHHKQIKKLVTDERKKLIDFKLGETVAIQMEHAENGEQLDIPVFSIASKSDSVVVVNSFRPIVKSLLDVEKPDGYLIPADTKELTDLADRQGFIYEPFDLSGEFKIEQYFITGIDSIDFEKDIIINPNLEKSEILNKILIQDYLYIPVAQLKGNMIVQALEPKSMLGLVTYDQFNHLLKPGETYTIFRVLKNGN